MARRSKPLGWPRYMVDKRLSGGRTGYYWDPPSWAKNRGCPFRAEALGAEYGPAKARCDDLLNVQFDAWRRGDDSQAPRAVPGTFDWLVAVYKDSPQFRRLTVGSRADYDRALAMVADHQLKDGRRFGELNLAGVSPGAADKLHDAILSGGRGNRMRTAKLAMDVCRRAWKISWRLKSPLVPHLNPFERMGISYRPQGNRAATYEELRSFVAKADERGFRSIGTAAMIAFYWLQREEDIFLRLAWTHYRPQQAPGTVRVFHNKTDVVVDVPLYDDDGDELWPELTARLDSEPHHGTLIVMRDAPDRRRGLHLPWATSASNPVRHVQRVVRAITDAAGLSTDITFTSFRHGGHTDAADSGLSDAQIRALSGHRSATMVPLYAKRTMDQRRSGARKRLEARRTKGGNLSE